MKKGNVHLIEKLILTIHFNIHLGIVTDDIEYKFNEISYNKKTKGQRNLSINEFENQIKVFDVDDDDEDPIHTFEKKHIASIMKNGEELWDSENQTILIKEAIDVSK